MLLAFLLIVLLFGGGWGYYGYGAGYSPYAYGSPIGLIIFVIVLLFIFGGIR